MLILRLIFLKIIILAIFIKISCSLRCRTEDGPSDGELKRVVRSCMRKFGDIAFTHNSQQQQQMQYNQQQQQEQSQGKYRQRITNKENSGYNYDDSEENDKGDYDDEQYYNNNNNNNNRKNHRQQNGNNQNDRGGHDGNNGDGNNDHRQRNRTHYNGSNQNRTTNGNTNNNWNYSNQRNSMSNFGNNNNNNNNNNKNNTNTNYNNQNNFFSDAACIAHCFFVEMHMLNNNDYPDRHKMLFILTKDLRDRELRHFYTDTIQECFRYLENQRRRDKCQFSRDLITCMTEYAKGNCDDWNQFNMMFN